MINMNLLEKIETKTQAIVKENVTYDRSNYDVLLEISAEHGYSNANTAKDMMIQNGYEYILGHWENGTYILGFNKN